jgi:hypothetical protein
MKGTRLADWAGLKATGRSMDVPVAYIFEFDNDRLKWPPASTSL